MAKRKVNTVKLGLFVIITLLLFSYGLYRIGDTQNLFGNTIILYADFKEVNGLRAGNNVRYAGIRIGTVTNIKILNDTSLRVVMQVDQSVSTYMKKNASAEITTNGLVGNMLVAINPGKGTADLINAGDLLKGQPKVEMNAMLDQLASTNKNVEEISRHLLSITQKIDGGEGSLAILLNDAQLGQSLLASTRHLQQVSKQLDQTSSLVSEMIIETDQGKGNLGYLLKDTSLKFQLNELNSKVQQVITKDAGPILDSLQSTSKHLAKISQGLLEITERLDQGNSLTGVLLSDSIAAQNLQLIMHNLEKGTAKFDTNMKALQSNWLLKKYFKKEAKKEKKNP